MRELREEEELGKLKRYRVKTRTLTLEKTGFFEKPFFSKKTGLKKPVESEMDEIYAELLFKNISEPGVFLDRNGRITKVNSSFLEFSGYTMDALVGRYFWEITGFFSKDDSSKCLEMFKKTVSRGKTFSLNITVEHDEDVVLELVFLPVKKQSRSDSVIVIGKEIKERKEQLEGFSNMWEHDVISENSGDLISLLTFERNPVFTYVNPAHKKTLGFDKKDLVGKPFFDFVHPEDQKRVFSLLRKYLIKKELVLSPGGKTLSEKIELRVKDKKGRWHVLESTVNVAKAKKEILAISRDVTEQRKKHEETGELNRFFGQIIDNANIWLSVFDQKGKVFIWNKAAEEISGFSRIEAIGDAKIWRLIYPDRGYRNKVFKKMGLGDVKAGCIKNLETVVKCKNDEMKTISWNIGRLVDEKNRTVNIVAAGRDVTENKKMKDALSESERKYRTLTETSPDGIFTLDQHGRLTYVNPAMEEMFAMSSKELVNTSFFDYLTEESARRLKELFSRLVNNVRFTSEKIGLRALDKNKNVFPVEISASPIIVNEESKGLVCIARDVTDFINTQNELKKRIIALERYKQATINRELRIIELKQEVNEVLMRYGEKPKYFEIDEEVKEKYNLEEAT